MNIQDQNTNPNTDDSESNSPKSLEELIADGEEQIERMDDALHDSASSDSVAADSSMSTTSLPHDSSGDQEVPDGMEKEDFVQEEKGGLFGKLGSMFKKKKGAPGTGDHIVTDDKGNAFTKMFVDEEEKQTTPEEILIQNIITQSRRKQQDDMRKRDDSGEKSGDKKRKKILDLKNQEDAKKILSVEEEKQKKAHELLQVSKIFAGVSALVPIMSYLLSALFLSTNGFFSTLIEHKNYGLINEEKQEQLDRTEDDIKSKQETIDELKAKIAEVQQNEVLSSIISSRIQWEEVFDDIAELTNRAFEGNVVSKYVVYNSYTGDSKTGDIRVSGTVRNPGGKTFKSIIELQEAIDEHQSFDFQGAIIRRFYKTPCAEDEKITSSEYCTPVSFTFKYLPESPPAILNASPSEE